MPLFQRNPYLNRSMIRRPEQFFGRRREAMRVMQRLGASPPQSVAIVGDRRIGKSSLLHFVSRPEIAAQYLEDPERTCFLFIDFQEARGLTVEAFFQATFRRLAEARGQDVVADLSPDYDGFHALLARLAADDIRLILLLDEFDRVTRSASFDADFYSFLRGVAGHHDLAFVTSSGRELQELCHTDEIADSPFFNIFSTVTLGSLTEDEARDLVLNPARDLELPVAEYLDLILTLGGRWPFFLQIAASTVFEALLEDDTAPQSLAQERFAEETMPHFQFYWEQMDPVSRGLCNEIACGRDVGAGTALTDLLRRGFVVDDGQPRLFSTSFADFIRETYALEIGDLPIEVQAERARELESEVEKARQLQLSLLPRQMPVLPGLEFAASVVPASEVCGDFYTFVELEGERLALVVVDVCGHGMEAAVIAMRLSETLRYEARGRTEAGAILAGLNQALHGSMPRGGFVGCCICVFAPRSEDVDVAVCGFHPPLHWHGGTVTSPPLGAVPLGVRPDVAYTSVPLRLAPGDALLVFSDGVIEAEDDRREFFGQERLEALLRDGGARDLPSADIVDSLLRDIGRFTASAGGAGDDITAIAVRRAQ